MATHIRTSDWLAESWLTESRESTNVTRQVWAHLGMTILLRNLLILYIYVCSYACTYIPYRGLKILRFSNFSLKKNFHDKIFKV